MLKPLLVEVFRRLSEAVVKPSSAFNVGPCPVGNSSSGGLAIANAEVADTIVTISTPTTKTTTILKRLKARPPVILATLSWVALAVTMTAKNKAVKKASYLTYLRAEVEGRLPKHVVRREALPAR